MSLYWIPQPRFNTFSGWTYVEWAWGRFVKLFTCDYALDTCDCAFDVAIFVLTFDSVLMGCFEYESSESILSAMPA